MVNQPSSLAKPTAAFVGASWTVLLLGVVSFAVGLWNATLIASEKGFYGLAFAMTLFAAVAVQKNVRDALQFRTPPLRAADEDFTAYQPSR
jgi:uncharacterized membrane protein YiaA